jgi:sterol desaturase/sphingolipid hydroxylase (fatty acid hydroxylase superfamily)
VRLPREPLRRVLVAPDFHHWHHSSGDEAIDKNYVTQFAFSRSP